MPMRFRRQGLAGAHDLRHIGVPDEHSGCSAGDNQRPNRRIAEQRLDGICQVSSAFACD
jgi:hypothetical protein